MRYKIIILYVVIISNINSNCFGQEFVQDKSNPDKPKSGFDINRMFFGGGLGMSFGTESIITINPQVGYRITDKLSSGVGFSYNYYSYNRAPSFSTNIYGGNLFASYIVFDNFFLHTEYEMLSVESKYMMYQPVSSRTNIESFFVGGGYKYPLGKRAYLNIMVLWNLIESKYSLYPNPLLRMNFEL